MQTNSVMGSLVQYKCKSCEDELEVGVNWTEGAARNNDYYCADCRTKKQREYYHKNKDRIREQQNKKYYKRREDVLKRQREANIRKKYGMSVEEYDEAVSTCCGICGKEDNLVMDHDHSTGEVRGVLCSKCNVGIGLLGDSAENVKAALEYLTFTCK